VHSEKANKEENIEEGTGEILPTRETQHPHPPKKKKRKK